MCRPPPWPIVLAMNEEQPRRAVIELQVEAGCVVGVLREERGRVRPFSGLLGLFAVLEESLADGTLDAPGGGNPTQEVPK